MATTGRPRIVVVGAGVFGMWTAWLLLSRGAEVTLVDAWGPANSRSSSGDESRIIRRVYGDKAHYIEMTERSYTLWAELEAAANNVLLRRSGALWFFGEDDSFVRNSLPHLPRGSVEPLDPATAGTRFPQVDWGDVRRAYFEPGAGYLLARRSIQALARRFTETGGEIRIGEARSPEDNDQPGTVMLTDGTRLKADRIVYACGPWLGLLFPHWIGSALKPSRQEIFYFGTPAGDASLSDPAMPAFVDEARGSWYGIPGNENRGFKISTNDLGPEIDPSREERLPTTARLAAAREHLAHRFPRMANAPLIETRICQYENTPDRELIVDRFPGDPAAIVIGGGSGHGFKMGPAVGEMAARMALDGLMSPTRFAVSRFARA